jgi:peptidoglycan/xylan/chitin deacetylase (PgdA/CDA1 family)
MYLVKTPWWLRALYSPALTWKLPNNNKEIYLTFDDGPHPEATPFVLDCLKRYNAKGTFFCIGNNVQQYQEIYARIIDEGHRIGNHTYNHLNGWKVSNDKYFENIREAGKVIDSKLFRPPYGRITRSQIKSLSKDLKIIMWDVLSADFDTKRSGEECYLNVVNNTKPGSIIVFHDSEKAFERVENALPRCLEYFSTAGYQMAAIL